MTVMEFRSRIKDPFIYVDARIEDLDLDAFTYRCYTRFVYRGRNSQQGHFESQKNVAKSIHVSERKIRDCIKILISLNMIEVEKRSRDKDGQYQTNVIILTDPNEWINPTKEKIVINIENLPAAPRADGQRHHVPTASGTWCRLTRSQIKLDPKLTINAVEQPATAQNEKPKIKKKPWSPPSSPKLWEEKSEKEKFKSLIGMVRTVHRDAVNRKKAFHFEFDDIPDLLKPIITLHGYEVIKSFLDKRMEEKSGCNVRILGKEILREVDKKLDDKEPISPIGISQEILKETTFSEKVIEQMERNMGNIGFLNKDNKKEVEEIISKLSLEHQNWFNSLEKKHQRCTAKDFRTMTHEQIIAYLNGVLDRNRKRNFININENGEMNSISL